MAVVLALIFLALMLTVVSANLRPVPVEPPDPNGDVGGLIDANNELRGLLEAAREENDELKGLLGAAGAVNDELKGRLAAADVDIGELEDINRGFGIEIDDLGGENTALEGQIDELESRFSVPWWLIGLGIAAGVAMLVANWVVVRERQRVLAGSQLSPWSHLLTLLTRGALLAAAAWTLHSVGWMPDKVATVIALPWWAFLLAVLALLAPIYHTAARIRFRIEEYNLLRKRQVIRSYVESV